MSPPAGSRLESLGFREVYDYAAGKADWFAAGLPVEGEAAGRLVLGKLVRSDVASGRLDERVGAVGRRAEAAGWDQAVVLDDRAVLLGWLSQDALRSEPAAEVVAVMLGGAGTVPPHMGIAKTASWMDTRNLGSILVTSSDGTFLGVVRRQDLDIAEPAAATAEA